MTHSRIFIFIVPTLLFFIFVTAPTLIMPGDMWDGVIIEYASMIHNYSGLEVFFVESTWFLQYPLSLFVIKSAQVLELSYKNANALLVLGIAIFLFREVFLISDERLKLSRSASYYAVILVATYSTWGVLFSSIMTFHFGCVTLGLFSIRMIFKDTKISNLGGYIGLVASLGLQSQFVFLPILSYFFDITRGNNKKYFKFPVPSNRTLSVLIASLALFLILRIFLPPHGLYEDYNSLISLNPKELADAFTAAIALGSYLVPVVSIIGILCFVMCFEKQSLTNLFKIRIKTDFFFLVSLLFLFIAGIFPYAAVGKYSHFLDIYDWGSRMAILLALPASLFAALSFQLMYDASATKLVKKLVVGGCAVLLVFQISLLSVGLIYKLNRQIFVTELENLIRLNEERLSPGVLEIIGNEAPGPTFRGYEANFLMYNATGRADWWTRIGREKNPDFTIPCYMKVDLSYQIKYVYNYLTSHDFNHTIVEVDVTGFTGLGNALRNVVGIDSPGLVKLAKVYTKSGLDGAKNCN